MKLRIFLVVASCLVSLITGFVISRSGSPTESVRARAKPLIGLSMDTLKEERWQGDRDLFVTRATELGADVLVQSANRDRKSTRLNSSHITISYAVFCLKKKT